MKKNKPPYVVAKKQKHYSIYYFQVPAHIRPETWVAAIRLGQDDQNSLSDIYAQAWKLKADLDAERKRSELKGAEIRHVPGTLPDLIEKYQRSDFYTSLSPDSRDAYHTMLKKILAWSKEKHHPHLKHLEAKHIYKFLSQYDDKPRTRKYLKATFSVLLNYAVIQGHIPINIAKDIKLPKARVKPETYNLWERQHIDAFIKTADNMGYPNAGTAVLLAFETGQRQTDIFKLQDYKNYMNGRLDFVQSKTGQAVNIPATQILITRLQRKPQGQLLLTVNDTNYRPWDKSSFNKIFRKVCKRAGLEGYQFRKIRNSLTVIGERAGMTDEEFHSVFGWSRATVHAMKDKHYGSADQKVADRGMGKILSYSKKLEGFADK